MPVQGRGAVEQTASPDRIHVGEIATCPREYATYGYRIAAFTQPRLNQVEQAPDWLNFLLPASGNPLVG